MRSRGLGFERLVVAVILAILIAGCSGRVNAPVEQRPSQPSDAHAPATYYTVERGDTLYAISWRHGKDFRDVARWNGIDPPYTIYPGQRIRLKPPPSGARQDDDEARTPTADKPERQTPAASKREGRGSPSSGREKRRSAKSLRWQWPVKGRIAKAFHAQAPGKKGIAISGDTGDPIRAAARGRVVYTGSGLIGYGKLIIVKHNETFLSAYGHNQTMLVEEGQQVQKGQHIADMGTNGAQGAMLHFEIRRNGTPIDPLRYLPKQ